MFVPFDHHLPLSLTILACSHHSTLCWYNTFLGFMYIIEVSYIICLSLSDLFHLASMLSNGKIFFLPFFVPSSQDSCYIDLNFLYKFLSSVSYAFALYFPACDSRESSLSDLPEVTNASSGVLSPLTLTFWCPCFFHWFILIKIRVCAVFLILSLNFFEDFCLNFFLLSSALIVLYLVSVVQFLFF